MLYVHNMQPCIFFVLHRYLHTHTHTFCTITYMYSHIEYISDTLEGQTKSNYFNYTSLFFSFEAWRKMNSKKSQQTDYINTFSFKNKHTKTKSPDVWVVLLLQPSRHAHSLHVHHRWFGLGSFMARCNLEFDEATPGVGGFWSVRNFFKTTPLKISIIVEVWKTIVLSKWVVYVPC